MSLHHPDIGLHADPSFPTGAANSFAASMASHDIRNALTTIDLLIGSMRVGPDWIEQLGPHSLATLAQRAERASHRIANLCKAFLTHEPGTETTTLRDLLADIVAITPQHPHVDLNLIVDPDCACATIAHDHEAFRIVMNLVTNAITATALRGGGSVSIEARMSDAQVVIDVRDEGGGFDSVQDCAQDPNPHVTGGCVSTDSFREMSLERKGHGLGIMIAMTLAARTGGSLQVSQNDESGATIRFSCPLQE